jgi:phage/plasmid-associated DNA primase
MIKLKNINKRTGYIETIYKEKPADKMFSHRFCQAGRLTFKNGILNLRDGVFKVGFDKNDYVNGEDCAFNYSEDIDMNKLNEIMETIKKICNYKDTHTEYFLYFLGASMTGEARKIKNIHLILGSSANNGKTTIFNIFSNVFRNIVLKVNHDILLESSNKKHKYIDGLDNKRLIYMEEMPKSQKLSASTLKELVDGGDINNEVMFGTTRLVKVSGKIVMLSNHIPVFDGDDKGMKTRFRQMTFNSQFKDCQEDDYDKKIFKRDLTIEDRLSEYVNEWVYLIKIYSKKFYNNDMKIDDLPEDWKQETEDIVKYNMSSILRFLTEHVKKDDNQTINRDLLGEQYSQYIGKPVDIGKRQTLMDFNKAMNGMGIKYNRHKKQYEGCSLKVLEFIESEDELDE